MSVRKYILTGHVLEVYDYEKFVHGKGGDNKDELDLIKKELGIKDTDEIEDTILLNYSNHNVVRRNMIRRLACANFEARKSTFFTFTFDDKLVKHDIHNVKECNVVFKNFIKRLKYNMGLDNLKYLAVIEFQDKNDRRAVHYHVLFNEPFLDIHKVSKIWGQGFVFVTEVKHVDNIGAYLVKYMTKDNDDERLMGLPAYLSSKNLARPTSVLRQNSKSDKESSMYIKIDSILSNSSAVYEAEYETEYMGHCSYKQYNLERYMKNET